MNKEELFSAIGEIDDDIVVKGKSYVTKKRVPWVKWGSMVACVCLILTISFISSNYLFKDSNLVANNENVVNENINSNTDENQNEIDNSNSDAGIFLPPIKLPQADDSINFNMIGLVVYKGSIYTQAEIYSSKEEVNKIEPLIGEYLGHAKGNINEWSNQDDYALELASTCQGEVYSVNGYSTDFRICIIEEYEDKGEKVKEVWFLENLNNIRLVTGSDLLEKDLKITGNISSINWTKHNEWSDEEEKFYELDCTEEFEEFYNEVINSNFEYVSETHPDIYDGINKRVHLYLNMKDGTKVKLSLIEGGYVGYDHLGWYFVKIKDEAFNLIFDKCK